MRILQISFAVLLIALFASAEAHAADAVVGATGHGTRLEAFQGRVVWSDWDPQQNAYRLVELVNGAVRPLPVAPRPQAFDLDLGPDRRGETIAVYSRCTREPIIYWELDGRRGCDLYAYSFATSRERKLSPSGSRTDEYFPTIWRNRIAFTRTYRAPARSLPRRVIYWRSLSRRLARRLSSRRGAFLAPHDLDMRGNRVASIWNTDSGGAEIRVSPIGDRQRIISTAPGSGAAAIEYSAFGTSLAAGSVYWFVDQASEMPYLSELRRHAIGATFDERARVQLDESIDAFAQDGDTSYYALPTSHEKCARIPCLDPHEIHRLDGLQFERAGKLPLR